MSVETRALTTKDKFILERVEESTFTCTRFIAKEKESAKRGAGAVAVGQALLRARIGASFKASGV